jgi:hypothetical protein
MPTGESLRRVTSAANATEAEMIATLLRGAGIRCLVQRSPAFDVPEFLAAGPRVLFVRAEDWDEAAALVESHFGLR